MQKLPGGAAEAIGERTHFERGFAKGFAEGFVIGWREGRREVVLEQLAFKFGKVSTRSRRKFQQLRNGEIDRIAFDLLNVQKLEELGL